MLSVCVCVREREREKERDGEGNERKDFGGVRGVVKRVSVF